MTSAWETLIKQKALWLPGFVAEVFEARCVQDCDAHWQPSNFDEVETRYCTKGSLTCIAYSLAQLPRSIPADRGVVRSPNCESGDAHSEPRSFNLMNRRRTRWSRSSPMTTSRVSPARDGSGHLRQLPQCVEQHPPQAPVRHRPGRQGVPQRDQPAELHLPLPRVRADGDRVLLPPGPSRGSGTSTGVTSGSAWYSTLGIQSDNLRPREQGQRRTCPLLRRHHRHRVHVPVQRGAAGTRRGRPPRRLRPEGPRRQESARPTTSLTSMRSGGTTTARR